METLGERAVEEESNEQNKEGSTEWRLNKLASIWDNN